MLIGIILLLGAVIFIKSGLSSAQYNHGCTTSILGLVIAILALIEIARQT